MNKKVVVGLSGGVDSAVAAYLLKKQGFEVYGATMNIWQEDCSGACEHSSCGGSSALSDASSVADKLGIPFSVIDFRKEFKNNVIDYFCEEYINGRTPNPCIACNRHIKWEALIAYADSIGADYIATGHYARITRLDNGRYAICNSATARKDQTYALYQLTQEQLSRTLMPVGDYTKDRIRELANEAGFDIANKAESMEICFIPDNDYARYIEEHTDYSCRPGNFVDTKGNILGEHKGIINYTVGQRKGLGIALGRPMFVVDLNMQRNEVVLGDDADVFTDRLYASHINLMGLEAIDEPIRVKAKIRYSAEATECMVRRISEDMIECIFDKPVRAVTPGQAVVLYLEGYVLGGAIIDRTP